MCLNMKWTEQICQVCDNCDIYDQKLNLVFTGIVIMLHLLASHEAIY